MRYEEVVIGVATVNTGMEFSMWNIIEKTWQQKRCFAMGYQNFLIAGMKMGRFQKKPEDFNWNYVAKQSRSNS